MRERLLERARRADAEPVQREPFIEWDEQHRASTRTRTNDGTHRHVPMRQKAAPQQLEIQIVITEQRSREPVIACRGARGRKLDLLGCTYQADTSVRRRPERTSCSIPHERIRRA
ncbi:hypothetical protein LZC95_50370 [Pendulispora brunnea]|uniref:Uncharacterized protein n=1 Tax=Pendulispora brunnea TaxID=2905690 RepID=A0ABZ2KB53_9BACT